MKFQISRLMGFKVGIFRISPISVVVICFAAILWQPCNKVHGHCMVIRQQSYHICKTNEPRQEKTNILHMRNKEAGQLQGNREADFFWTWLDASKTIFVAT